MNILVAEDDPASALLLERILTRKGHHVRRATDGQQALDALARERFDAVLTDWMMPSMDGIELIRRVRAAFDPPPILMMITALDSPTARARALEAGADDYLAKPYDPQECVERLHTLSARREQPAPASTGARITPPAAPAPFVGVFLVASTGGPTAISEILRGLTVDSPAAFFVVLHGPNWMVATFARALERDTPMRVRIAQDGLNAVAGELYIAPGGHHLTIEPRTLTLRLVDSPPENYVRPSGDLLLRSAAKAFGSSAVAVVLTGMGRDGALGAEQVSGAGGVVIVQDPETAVAPTMPSTVIQMGVPCTVVPLSQIARSLARSIEQRSRASRTA